jgi:uncharacterized protein
MRGTFLLDVHDLDSAGKTYEAPVTAGWLRGALEGIEGLEPAGPDGELSVRFSRTGSDVVVKGHVRAQLTAPCARCLEPTQLDVDGELALMLVPSTSPKAAFAKGLAGGGPSVSAEYEISENDAELDTYEGETVVLDAFLREAILLEVPTTPLCSEGCQGIAPPPEQGAPTEPTVDPRLAPLLKFMKKGTSLTRGPAAPSAFQRRSIDRGRPQAKNNPLQR